MVYFYAGYLLFMNLLAFFLMLADKKLAQAHKWRIPERTLLTAALFGGGGRRLSRHADLPPQDAKAEIHAAASAVDRGMGGDQLFCFFLKLALRPVGRDDIGVVELNGEILAHGGNVARTQRVAFAKLVLGQRFLLGFVRKLVDPGDDFLHIHNINSESIIPRFCLGVKVSQT